MKHYLYLILLFFISIDAAAQFGGTSTYDFLNLTSSARINALGGNQVGIIDSSELSFAYYNPATLMPDMHNSISINYIDYISDIKIGYASYARHFDNIGTFSTGIQFINYGDFLETDEEGEITGTFTAGDYALNIIYSRNIWKKLNIGANIKPIYSSYESYTSFGIAADLGLSIADSSGNFNAGFVLKNMGTQITTYNNTTNEYEPLPFDIQFGFSQRLAHAPFRFNATFQYLTEWNLSDKSTWDYDNEDDTDYLVGSSDDIIKQIMRHVILGVEFIPSENFIIGFGYNFQRSKELSVTENPGAVGFSGGFTIRVSKFRISYAVASYHLSGTSNIFSVSTNLSEFAR
jgi:hypothetical protein